MKEKRNAGNILRKLLGVMLTAACVFGIVFCLNGTEKTSAADDPVAWVEYDGEKTLYFHYDTGYPGSDEADGEKGKGWWKIPDDSGRLKDAADNGDLWFSKYGVVETIEIDEDFGKYEPKSMSYWFSNFDFLTSIKGLENLNTENVTDMSHMFYGCSVLESLDIGSFNTGNVTDMSYMFCDCESLQSLDLSSFKTGNVTDMSRMFLNCNNLRSILVSDNFETTACKKFDYMFSNCYCLIGGKGTAYAYENVDAAYAHIDGGVENPGYFTDITNLVTWVKYDGDKTLFFYYNNNCPGEDNDASEDGEDWWKTPDDINELGNASQSSDLWYSKKDKVNRIVIDVNFMYYKPVSTAFLFGNLPEVTSIDGLRYLNTENVTDMSGMFTSDSGLEELDLRSFNTSKVTKMSRMFAGCSGLEELDLSSFNTSKVTDMSYMFSGCSGLQRIVVSDSFKTDSCTSSDDMFYRCNELTGGKGTTYNSSKLDKTYAMIDDGTSAPGYFTDVRDIPVAWVEYDSDKTLYFHYDKNYPGSDESDGENGKGWWKIPADSEKLYKSSYLGDLWFSKCNVVKKIEIDEGFRNYEPKSMSCWFSYFRNVTSIEGLENLNTKEVMNMSRMFCDCVNLKSLDLSSFNTENVTGMSHMFFYCEALESLDISSFNAEKVTNMYCMFYGCENLESLDLSSFNTENVTNMSNMFYDCNALDSLDLSSFNTENVTDMSYMFYKCRYLQSILVSKNFDTVACENSDYMFYDCISLVGGKGTAYDGNKTDKAYASIDGGSEAPGYFTDIRDIPVAWVEYDGEKILYFHYDTGYPGSDEDSSENGKGWWKIPDDSELLEDAAWYDWLWFSKYEDVKKIKLDEDFRNYKPQSMSYWFGFFENVTSIKGLENLNTENVTDMSNMFYRCEGLQSLDLSSFNTGNVTDMSYMFCDCESLQSLDLSSFKTGNVTDMSYMFYDCYTLKSLDISSFNTENVKNMSNMFPGSKDLESLDISSFNTENVTDMSYMFTDCRYLQSILVSKNFKTVACEKDDYMFFNCTSLVGGKGVAYDSNNVGKELARIDGGSEAPGYFTDISEVAAWVKYDGNDTLTFYYDNKYPGTDNSVSENGEDWWEINGDINLLKNAVSASELWYSEKDQVQQIVIDGSFVNYRPVSTACWFADLANVTTVKGLEYLNTKTVTDMSDMFSGCSSLASLDLSSFNTAKVTNMSDMFSDCSGLASLDLRSFNTEKVTNMSGMFSGCSGLQSIVVSDSFKTDSCTSSDDMFYSCTSLTGGKGTNYNNLKLDKAYAKIDDGTSAPGYFSDIRDMIVAWVEYDGDKTLYFHYNKNYPGSDEYDGENGKGWWEIPDDSKKLDYASKINGLWLSKYDVVQKIEIDEDFMNYEPKSMSCWFCYFENVTSIEGLENLNTEKVTDMSYMFYGCRNLESFDLRSFDTEKVTDMTGMFYGCGNLKSLDLSSFNTEKVTDMSGMFYGCGNLESLDLRSFNTENVTDMYCMFYGCGNLESLDLRSFNTEKVTDMSYMFYICSALKRLDLSSFNTKNVTDMSYMFYECRYLQSILVSKNFNTGACENSNYMFFNCTSLVGGNGTAFNDNHTDGTYARIDDGSEAPGYFTSTSSHKLTVAECVNGTITVYVSENGKKTDVTGTEKDYGFGENVIIELKPAENYQVKSVSAYMTGDPTRKVVVKDGSFSMPNYDVTISAEFELSDEYVFSEYIKEVFAGLDALGTDIDGIIAAAENQIRSLQQASGMTLKAKMAEADRIASRVSEDLATAGEKAKKAASAVSRLINEIGNVVYSTECRQKIEAARSAYNALTEYQKSLVPAADINTLATAESRYNRLKPGTGGSTSGGSTSGGSTSGGSTSGGSTSGGSYSGGGTYIDLSGITTGEGKDGTGETDGKTTDEVTDGTGEADGNTAGEGSEGNGEADASQNSQPAPSVPAGKENVSVKKGKGVIPSKVTADGKKRPVTKLSADAFSNSKKLKNVELPSTIEIIGRRAFKNCRKLTEVKFSENLRQINQSAFYGCSSLKNITLGDGVKTIGAYAFKNCTSLKDITLGSGVKTLSRSVFSGCTSLESIVIPAGVKSMGANLFYGCSSLKKITIETTKLTEKTLAKGAFKNVPKDMVIYVPKSKLNTYTELFRSQGLSKKVKIKAIKKNK